MKKIRTPLFSKISKTQSPPFTKGVSNYVRDGLQFKSTPYFLYNGNTGVHLNNVWSFFRVINPSHVNVLGGIEMEH